MLYIRGSNFNKTIFMNLKFFSFLFLAGAVLCSASFIQAQDTVKVYRLKDVVITTERSNPTKGTIAPIAVFNRGKIESSPLQTIESALKSSPSIDLRERGSMGMQADISVYGGTPDQSMVMLNGVNFTDVRTGHQSHSLPVDIEGVSGIDIISGIPGPGAFAGAVNILTVPEYNNYVKANFSAGAHGYLYGNLSGAITKGNATAMIIGSLRRSDGYTSNTDFDNQNLYARMLFRSVKGGVFDIQAGAQNRFFGANDFYSLDYPDQAERTRTYLGSVKWDDNFGKDWSAKVIFSYRKNYDKFELFRDGKNAASWYPGPNYHDTDNFGFSASVEHKGWLGGTTGAGFDYNYNHIYSNVLGEALDSPKKIAGVPGGFYTKGADRNVTNEWLRHVYGHGLISIPLSLNLVQSSYGGDFMWSGGVNVNFYPLITVSFSVTRSMRLPTYTDLYYTTATHEANSDLNPEKATTYRIAMDFTGTNLRLAETGSATGGNYYDNFWNHFNARFLFYYRDGRNIIDWVRAENETLWKSLQIGKVHARGTELSAEFVSWKFIKSLKAGYAHIHMNKKAEGYVSKTALDYLKDKVSLSGQFALCKRVEADVFATWCDRVGGYYGAAVTTTTGTGTGATTTKTYPYIDYKSFWKVDAAISYELVKKADMLANIYLKASNLFNERYYDCGGIKMPGTWISAGVSITLF